MIDWLLNILYNIGMFIGAIIALIGVVFYLSGEAERKDPNVANQRMLYELRKLNRLQREQIELEKNKLEKTAQVQAATPPLTQWQAPAAQPPAFINRINAKLERFNARIEAYVERKKQEKIAKRMGKAPTGIAALWDRIDAKLEQWSKSPDTYLLHSKQEVIEKPGQINSSHTLDSDDLILEYAIQQHQEQLEAVRLTIEDRRQTLAEAEANITPEFWEQCAEAKAECIALGDTKGLAYIETQLAELEALRQETRKAVEEEEATLIELEQRLYAMLHSSQNPAPHSRSTPPPLPAFN